MWEFHASSGYERFESTEIDEDANHAQRFSSAIFVAGMLVR